MRLLLLISLLIFSPLAKAENCKIKIAENNLNADQTARITKTLRSLGYSLSNEKSAREWRVLATSGALIGEAAKNRRDNHLKAVNKDWNEELFVAYAKIGLVHGKITPQTLSREIHLKDGSPTIFTAITEATKLLPLCQQDSMDAFEAQPSDIKSNAEKAE